jgi:hypothetical protein
MRPTRAAAAVNPGSKITIEGLGKSSLQGDVAFADVLHQGVELVFGKDSSPAAELL